MNVSNVTELHVVKMGKLYMYVTKIFLKTPNQIVHTHNIHVQPYKHTPSTLSRRGTPAPSSTGPPTMEVSVSHLVIFNSWQPHGL